MGVAIVVGSRIRDEQGARRRELREEPDDSEPDCRSRPET
jgi:hypothetical protein